MFHFKSQIKHLVLNRIFQCLVWWEKSPIRFFFRFSFRQPTLSPSPPLQVQLFSLPYWASCFNLAHKYMVLLKPAAGSLNTGITEARIKRHRQTSGRRAQVKTRGTPDENRSTMLTCLWQHSFCYVVINEEKGLSVKETVIIPTRNYASFLHWWASFSIPGTSQ